MELININPDTIGFNLNSISFTHQAIKHTVDYEQIIFFYDIRKCDTDYAISRLKPLKSQIDNIRNAQKAKGIQIDNSGTTIVSPKASTSNNIMEEGLDGPVPTKVMGPNGMIQKTQKEVMEEKLTSRGLKNRIIVSSKGMDAVNLSAQLNNVKFHEIVETDVLAFCDAFSFPPELTPYGKRATFDNKELAEIALMESEIIPISENFAKSMMSVFPKRGEVFPSFKHINAMSLIEERIQKTNGTTIDQLTVLLEKEIISKEEFRKILQTKKIIENGKSR